MKFTSNKSQVKAALQQAKERTLEGVGVFLDGEATVRCPVDTGNLRGSINYQTNTADKSVTIGTPVEYGIYVEKGTYKMQAQPFLEPAIMENYPRIKQLVSELMKI